MIQPDPQTQEEDAAVSGRYNYYGLLVKTHKML